MEVNLLFFFKQAITFEDNLTTKEPKKNTSHPLSNMVWCRSCDRWFSNERSYSQHVENSSAHRSEESSYDEYSSSNGEPEFECYGCYECFWSEDARENHHTSDHDDRYCTPCKRMFTNANNLRQVSNLSLRTLDKLQHSTIFSLKIKSNVLSINIPKSIWAARSSVHFAPPTTPPPQHLSSTSNPALVPLV